MKSSKGLRALIGLLALALALTACGDDDAAVDTPTEDETEAAEGGEELEVTAVDYAFEGVPETVEAGTKLTFANSSEAEAHEMVLFRIADGEERPVQELLELGEEEAGEIVQFQGVAFAFPGEEAMYPEGDTTVAEPGRYAMVCFIPVGADVAKLKEAMAAQEEGAEGPPEMGDGPPHFTEGMVTEFTVS